MTFFVVHRLHMSSNRSVPLSDCFFPSDVSQTHPSSSGPSSLPALAKGLFLPEQALVASWATPSSLSHSCNFTFACEIVFDL